VVFTTSPDSTDAAINGDLAQSSNQINSTTTALHQPVVESVITYAASTSSTLLTEQANVHTAQLCSETMHGESMKEAATTTAAAMSTACTSAATVDADIGASSMTTVSMADAAVPAATAVCTALQHVSVCDEISMMSTYSSNGDSADHDTGISDAADPYNTAVVFSTVSDNISEVDATQAVTPISAQNTPSDESVITPNTELHDSSYNADMAESAAVLSASPAQAQIIDNGLNQSSKSRSVG
jgi:hypothetical protein